MADTLYTIKCPACQKEMTKVFIPSLNINIDVCLDGCGGIYFDNREFKSFDEPHEDIDALLKAKGDKVFEKVDETVTRHCPVCGAPMVKNYASIKKEVQVDECYSCGGKFLDHGELVKIRKQYSTEAERSADVMKEVYSTVGVEIKRLEENNKKHKEQPFMYDKYNKLVDFIVWH